MKKLLSEVMTLVFPMGTNADANKWNAVSDSNSSNVDWSIIPHYAADVFAFCAYVIQTTGLMGYFEPNPECAKTFSKNESLKIVLCEKDRSNCLKQSKKWREKGTPSLQTASLWKIIYDARNNPISVGSVQRAHRRGEHDAASNLNWWIAVFKLLIIADEACDSIGHFMPIKPPNNTRDLVTFDAQLKDNRLREARAMDIPGTSGKKARQQNASLAYAADDTVICIQPKGRVSGVGCSLRNISRNLAVTGPVGGVRCSWQQLLNECNSPSRKALNLLLIPLPHHINAKQFVPRKQPKSDFWGNFDIEQSWLSDEDKFIEVIVDLIKQSLADAGEVNGVIFPEMALNFNTFAKMMREIYDASDQKLEFLIAGSSGNCDGAKGNHVLTAIWECSAISNETKQDYFRIASQRKHHRWKLDQQQIATYGLGSALMPSKDWWEHHEIETRELNFFQFRRDAVFASLICEDLARNDPCHDIIRSVAPNLVFALLMDGPQLANRWPARYAGSLADDPGCTVLTLTSYGLIDRSNDHRPFSKSHSVGLLRDSLGTTTEIILPSDKDAVLLTLNSVKTEDRTLDGRETTNASKWCYISQRPISSGMRSIL